MIGGQATPSSVAAGIAPVASLANVSLRYGAHPDPAAVRELERQTRQFSI